MLQFVQEVFGAVVHGLLLLLHYFCVCYNLAKKTEKNNLLAAAHIIACLFEAKCVYEHIKDAFKEGTK